MVNGVSASVSTLAHHLRKQQVDVSIFAPAYGGHKDSDPGTVRFPSFKLPAQPDYPLAWPFSTHVARFVREHQFDLVHVNSVFTVSRYGARLARQRRLPLVFTYHTVLQEYVHYARIFSALARSLVVKWSRDFANRADCVIAPTKAIREMLRGYGATGRIEVIPTGLEADLLPGDDVSWVRQQYNIAQDAPLLVFVGRLAKEKRVDVLLEAFKLVASKHAEAVLAMVGGGPWEALMKDKAQKLGVADKVRFTGFVPRNKVMDILAAGDMFVLASDTETQSLTVVEAMRVGLPCVVVDALGSGEIVREAGCGLLASLEAEDFASKVCQLLEDEALRSRFGQAAREGARRYQVDVCAGRVLDVYCELVGSRAKR